MICRRVIEGVRVRWPQNVMGVEMSIFREEPSLLIAHFASLLNDSRKVSTRSATFRRKTMRKLSERKRTKTGEFISFEKSQLLENT
jgi:hypothetical protein